MSKNWILTFCNLQIGLVSLSAAIALSLTSCVTIRSTPMQSICHTDRQLRRGESTTVETLAEDPWNCAHVFVRRGNVYQFHVPPSQSWHDAWFRVEPDGHASWIYKAYLAPFAPFKRASSCGPFVLIGNVGKESTHDAFPIFDKKQWSPPTDGWLFCFANDVPGFYWNNSGSVTFTITRIK